ncbi:MAG: hypothetical protein V4602_19150 [Pseudomonadota bacterium]
MRPCHLAFRQQHLKGLHESFEIRSIDDVAGPAEIIHAAPLRFHEMSRSSLEPNLGELFEMKGFYGD